MIKLSKNNTVREVEKRNSFFFSNKTNKFFKTASVSEGFMDDEKTIFFYVTDTNWSENIVYTFWKCTKDGYTQKLYNIIEDEKQGANISKEKQVISALLNTIKRAYRQGGCREKNIIENLHSIEQKKEVPNNYTIFEFYNLNSDGFDAGKTPSGYGITN